MLKFLVVFDTKYAKALKCEKDKSYKDACRFYAEAIMRGSVFSKDCKKRFLQIWNAFGTFDYRQEIEAEIRKVVTPIKQGGDSPGHDAGVCLSVIGSLPIWVREQDAFLQQIDVLLGKKERVQPLTDVVIAGNKWTIKSVGPFLDVRCTKN